MDIKNQYIICKNVLSQRIGFFCPASQADQEMDERSLVEDAMKTMTCQQLGGACHKKFTANTFEEIAEMSHQHGTEMFEKGDEAHLKAMENMQKLMKDPDAMNKWFESKKEEFLTLPDN